ncbi:MAG: hypothetical protein U9Q82_07850 [Chloroflexota bacterium]|nr:hypothetical protein [Chloroflexota bacterium]
MQIFELLDFVGKTIAGDLVTVIMGVIFAHLIQNYWDQWRFGGWSIVIQKGGKTIMDEKLAASTRKELSKDDLTLRAQLKGLISPYAWINCDLLREGKGIGLFREDQENKRYLIDLDKNPQKNNPSHI